MYIQRITLNNFKNYNLSECEFSEGVNVLYGANGTGKTNLLDAVHYLSSCKSFLVSSDSQNIKSGNDFFFIEGWVADQLGNTEQLQCAVKKGQGKVFRRNKKEYEKLSDHIGFFPSVIIAPGDHELLHGGSVERRRFIDSLISVYDKNYLTQLIQYGKLIEQRNAFLKQCHERGLFRDDMLDIYDAQLEEPARFIFQKRNELLENLLPLFYDMYKTLSGTAEEPFIRVKADLAEWESPVQMWNQAREKDKSLLFTSAGPHKDDVEFSLSGLSLKSAASQGQQKTFLTALKLARFHLIFNQTKKRPVLLLDDIFDKLDETRVQNLMRIISAKPFGQVLITDTGKVRIHSLVQATGITCNEIDIHKTTVANETTV